VPTLLAEIEDLRGNVQQAAEQRLRARDHLDGFETYPELASLYYKLTWRRGEPLTRNELRGLTSH